MRVPVEWMPPPVLRHSASLSAYLTLKTCSHPASESPCLPVPNWAALAGHDAEEKERLTKHRSNWQMGNPRHKVPDGNGSAHISWKSKYVYFGISVVNHSLFCLFYLAMLNQCPFFCCTECPVFGVKEHLTAVKYFFSCPPGRRQSIW